MTVLPMERRRDDEIARQTDTTFRLGDTSWTCWVISGGCLEWRSDCGRLIAWREAASFYSTADGYITAQPHPTLRSAMLDAQCEGLLRAAGFRHQRIPTEFRVDAGQRWPTRISPGDASARPTAQEHGAR